MKQREVALRNSKYKCQGGFGPLGARLTSQVNYSKIARSTLYEFLEELEEYGLIKKTRKGGMPSLYGEFGLGSNKTHHCVPIKFSRD